MFAVGRAAAHDALRELGRPVAAIGRGPAGEPLWPAGVVGAISHSGELAVALVGLATDYAGLGLDVEQLVRGSRRARRGWSAPAEYAWLEARGGGYWGTMLFSAKEAVFKALYPIEHVWLGFADAELTWDDLRGVFTARLRKAAGAAYPPDSTLVVRCTLARREVLSTTCARA